MSIDGGSVNVLQLFKTNGGLILVLTLPTPPEHMSDKYQNI